MLPIPLTLKSKTKDEFPSFALWSVWQVFSICSFYWNFERSWNTRYWLQYKGYYFYIGKDTNQELTRKQTRSFKICDWFSTLKFDTKNKKNVEWELQIKVFLSQTDSLNSDPQDSANSIMWVRSDWEIVCLSHHPISKYKGIRTVFTVQCSKYY